VNTRTRGGTRFAPGPSIERARERVGTPAAVLARHGLRVRGRMAFCPFHANDRTPALSLYTGRDGRGRWKCHGCQASGDALDLEALLSGRPLADVIRDLGR
jgi:hypothetical protein